jgi:hypothetical protein
MTAHMNYTFEHGMRMIEDDCEAVAETDAGGAPVSVHVGFLEIAREGTPWEGLPLPRPQGEGPPPTGGQHVK